MSLIRSKIVWVVFLQFVVLHYGKSKQVIPNGLFKYLTSLNSSSDPVQIIHHLIPGMKIETIKNVTKQNNKLNSIKSRTLGQSAEQLGLDFDNQFCELRGYIHFFKQPPVTASHLTWPFSIKIPRCFGSCSTHQDVLKCSATKQRTVTFTRVAVHYGSHRRRREVMDKLSKDPVHFISKRSSSSVHLSLFNETVTIDTECRCKCQETNKSCAAKGLAFNVGYCRCDCPVVRSCNYPFQWDDELCKCVCSLDQKINSDKCRLTYGITKYWNQNTCQCQCHNLEIPCAQPHQKRNARTCGCS